jgi:hypothetical protein
MVSRRSRIEPRAAGDRGKATDGADGLGGTAPDHVRSERHTVAPCRVRHVFRPGRVVVVDQVICHAF